MIFISILVAALFSSEGAHAQHCDRALLPPDHSQTAWNSANFSLPFTHQDSQFQYIVHAGPNVTVDGSDPVLAFVNRLRTHDFNEDGFFSTSIISEKHTATFSLSGVILRIPQSKIVAATSDDMRSTHADEMNLNDGLRRFQQTRLPSPSEILEKTTGDSGFFRFDLSWTEVLIFGRLPSEERIEVAGVFTHRDSLGSAIVTNPRKKALESLAQELQVPLILLPPPQGQYVLKVRMMGNRVPTYANAMTDYGPQKIVFFASEEDVRSLFLTAKKQGKNVRLVDETQGPVAGLADESLFTGGWIERWGKKSHALVPNGTPPIEIHFPPFAAQSAL